MKHYQVVHIGNYTKDTIIDKSGTRVVDGGGFNYGARATVSFMDAVAVVTKLAEADTHVIDNLQRWGIDTYAIFSPHSTTLTLHYYSDNPDEREMLVQSLADPFVQEDLAGISADGYILAPSLKGEIPASLIAHLSNSGALVAIDAQGYIRVVEDSTIVYEPWTEATTILPMVSILKVDIAEAAFLTGSDDRYEAVRRLYAMGAKEILLTWRDGALVHDGSAMYEEQFKYSQLLGRSGRGDTCISSYAAARLNASIPEALKWSVALTSLKLEKEGPFDRSAEEVADLVRHAY